MIVSLFLTVLTGSYVLGPDGFLAVIAGTAVALLAWMRFAYP